MKKLLTALFLTLLSISLFAQADKDVEKLNALLEADWKKHQLEEVPVAPDHVFLRRAMLDIRGILPKPHEVKRFLADKNPQKRAKLIDDMLESKEYSELMAMRYSDMFRIKSEFPINLWPNAVHAYHHYFLENARHDRSFYTVTRELLTSNGSNFRVAPANFFRASANRTPSGLAQSTALSLLGMRFENFSDDRKQAFEGFFKCIKYKSTDEWKEEIVYNDNTPRTIEAGTPDGIDFTIKTPDTDPRKVLADWMTSPENRYFARAYVNRVWSWLFGKGIVDPADDMPLPENFWNKLKLSTPSGQQPSNPELLDFLADYFTKNNGSTKKLIRLIMLSKAYNAHWKTVNHQQAAAEKRFAVYPVRRLDSEVLVDIISRVLGVYEKYTSVIPEPFTFLPQATRAVQISDGSISSRLLDSFGRPPRDSGRISERKRIIDDSQRLFLMNSGWIYNNAGRFHNRTFGKKSRLKLRDKVDTVYLTILSRHVTDSEFKTIRKYQNDLKKKWLLWGDLVWALVNSKEFIYQH